MRLLEYRVGTWLALVGDGAVALLHPSVGSGVVRELWELTRTGSRLGTWVEYLAGAGISTLPSFAMVEAHPQGLRVLVRGPLSVRVGEQTLSGAGYATWKEEVLAGGHGFEIAAAETAQPPVAAEWLPAAGGIVYADAIRTTGADEHAGLRLPAGAEGDEEDLELTLLRSPALAAARARATPAVGAEDELEVTSGMSPEELPDPVLPAAEHLRGLGAGDVSGETDPAEEPGDFAEELGDFAEAPGASSESADTAGAPAREVLETTQVPEDEGVEAPDTAPQAADTADPWAPPAAGAPAPAEVPDDAAPALISSVPGRTGPLADEGDHDGETILPSQLPGSGPAAAYGSVAPASGAAGEGPYGDGDTEETIVQPGTPVAGHPGARPGVGQPADSPGLGAPADAEADRRTTGGQAGTAPPAPPTLELALSTGAHIVVDRPVLLGRAPEAARFRGAATPRLVTVPNPEKDISATHVEIRPAGDHVVVTDMNSTNGTVLQLPHQPAFRIHPGTGVPVPPGAVVELGSGVSLTVTGAGAMEERP